MNPPVVQPVAAPPPSFTVYNPPRQGYTAPYGPEPGIAMHPTSIDMTPPSYDQSVKGEGQPSAPPYNPYYKGSFLTHVKWNANHITPGIEFSRDYSERSLS